MNSFSIKHVRKGMRYAGEYRLAHWAGPKSVRDHSGHEILFAHPMDAFMAATNEFLRHLNGTPAYSGLMTETSAREAAEALFRGNANGESTT